MAPKKRGRYNKYGDYENQEKIPARTKRRWKAKKIKPNTS